MFVDQKKKKSYFSDRLTLSNIRGRTSSQIYRLALPLCTPETLSLSSKSSVFLYNAHLAPFVRRMTQLRSHKLIDKYRCLANLSWNYSWKYEHCRCTSCRIYRQLAESLQTGKECEYKELHFRRASPLACGVMGFAAFFCYYF